MSGTSVDGIDVALVAFDETNRTAHVEATLEYAFPDSLRDSVQAVIADYDSASAEHLTELDLELGKVYAAAVNKVLQITDTESALIKAVGCHGQTVQHQPDISEPFTHQLGHGPTIAAATGILTVNDFRSADIAAGGQGAPLAPAFHEWAFASEEPTAIVNIGGIANVTLLIPGEELSGYDTGPGNTLLDNWCARHIDQRFDADGAWAGTGIVNETLLQQLLADSYFDRPPPKSTGREYFHGTWLDAELEKFAGEDNPANVQATLAELTARTIADALRVAGVKRIFICGGGALNSHLLARIAAGVPGAQVRSTAELGIEPEWVEAIAFAWLAHARVHGIAAGKPSVTGARSAAVLGTVHTPPRA
jgi:anhydro-N-acetylmuramic acid kinase